MNVPALSAVNVTEVFVPGVTDFVPTPYPSTVRLCNPSALSKLISTASPFFTVIWVWEKAKFRPVILKVLVTGAGVGAGGVGLGTGEGEGDGAGCGLVCVGVGDAGGESLVVVAELFACSGKGLGPGVAD